jgi:hypothetical protein
MSTSKILINHRLGQQFLHAHAVHPANHEQHSTGDGNPDVISMPNRQQHSSLRSAERDLANKFISIYSAFPAEWSSVAAI